MKISDTACVSDPATNPTTRKSTGNTLSFGLLVAVLLSMAPIVLEHFRFLWHQPHYQFFPFVLVAVVYLLRRRLDNVPIRDIVPNATCLPYVSCILLAIPIFAVSVIFASPLVGTIALLVLLTSVIWCLSDAADNSLWPVWLLMLFVLKLPFQFDEKLIRYLQLRSSGLASAVLDQLGVNHVMDGNILQIRSRQLFVDEACSGIVSLFSILAVSATLAVWRGYGIVRAVCLMCIGVAWAFVLNLLRIVTIACADDLWDVDLVHGAAHTVLGLVLFCLMVIALLSSDQWLQFLLQPIPHADEDCRNPIISLWNRLAAVQRVRRLPERVIGKHGVVALRRKVLLALPFVTLGSWYAFNLVVRPQETSTSARVAGGLTAEALDNAEYEVLSFEEITRGRSSPFGAFSKVYTCIRTDRPETELQLSVDYPFFGEWHELTGCYVGSGWEVINRIVVEDEWPLVAAQLRKDGRHAFLVFSMIDPTGRPSNAPEVKTFLGRLAARARVMGRSALADEVIQFQVLTTSSEPINSEQQAFLIEAFTQLRSHLASQMFGRPLEL